MSLNLNLRGHYLKQSSVFEEEKNKFKIVTVF